MLIAFQIILLFVILVSFVGVVGETKDKKLRDNMTYLCIISSLSMLATLVLI